MLRFILAQIDIHYLHLRSFQLGDMNKFIGTRQKVAE